MNVDLIKIRKYYGENMMHLCRSLFPTLLETDNLLFNLIESNFAHSRYLYDDIIEDKMIEEFKNYIYSLVDVEKEEIEVIKTPKELLDEAGYVLYECKTEEDIQKFKKYYAKREELCTFQGGRLEHCHVFFAVKKNVEEIKRENFTNPTREDEYGTSVISIQFSKGNVNTLSIKNRYNHKVNNPDATFSNNLENITRGLTRSFEKEYNLSINQNDGKSLEMKNYVKANDGKYYKYNYEINNIYYCPNNIIIDNFNVKNDFQEKEKYIVLDYFILDLVNKKIDVYDKSINECFTDGLKNIKKIEICKEIDKKNIKFTFDNNTFALIEIDKYNRIKKYENSNLTTIGNDFLDCNIYLKEINLPNVTKVGNNFLCTNMELRVANLPKLKETGYFFLMNNEFLFPDTDCEEIGDYENIIESDYEDDFEYSITQEQENTKREVTLEDKFLIPKEESDDFNFLLDEDEEENNDKKLTIEELKIELQKAIEREREIQRKIMIELGRNKRR